ncbi:hypothetical protein [Streptomyces spiramenti]|uniref:MmyB family transcriptional regulator n=1 Tax=Streptomyces spiramenti TaxID=2720606 RepID=UPI003083FB4C
MPNCSANPSVVVCRVGGVITPALLTRMWIGRPSSLSRRQRGDRTQRGEVEHAGGGGAADPVECRSSLDGVAHRYDHLRRGVRQTAGEPQTDSVTASGNHSQFVRALLRASEEFAELWERHEVAQRFADRKTLLHPEVGALELDCQALFTEDRSQTLLVLTTGPRTESQEKLRLLSLLGTDRFTAAPGRK